MSQYPGSPPPPSQDPYRGGQPPADAWNAPPQQAPSDPYFGPPPSDPYAPPQDPYYGQPPQDAYYGQPPQDAYAQAQQQAWQAQQQAWQAQQQAGQQMQQARQDASRARGGSGAAIFGILLVIAGVWVLFGDQLDLDLDFSELWPIGAVVLGAIMVIASLIPRRGPDQG